MRIGKATLDALSREASSSPRLRVNMDLRTSPADGSQRMLNALEPGTRVPVHRHPASSETVVTLRGKCRQRLYGDDGRLEETVLMEAGTDCAMMSVEAGRWHSLEALAPGTVIFEAKDGAYGSDGSESWEEWMRGGRK